METLTDLYIIHIVFVIACVYCSHYWGHKAGVKRILDILLRDKVISERDLYRYVPEDE
jgi:hypothetical protein